MADASLSAALYSNDVGYQPLSSTEMRDRCVGDADAWPLKSRSIHHHLTVSAQFPLHSVCPVMTDGQQPDCWQRYTEHGLLGNRWCCLPALRCAVSAPAPSSSFCKPLGGDYMEEGPLWEWCEKYSLTSAINHPTCAKQSRAFIKVGCVLDDEELQSLVNFFKNLSLITAVEALESAEGMDRP